MKPPLNTPMSKPHYQKPANEKPTLLFVDDLAWYRRHLCDELLKTCGIRSIQAAHVLEAIRTLERNPQITTVVTDWRFDNGGPDGEALLETVKRRWPHVKRMLLSAYTDGPMIERGYVGGWMVRDKALPMDEIVSVVCALHEG